MTDYLSNVKKTLLIIKLNLSKYFPLVLLGILYYFIDYMLPPILGITSGTEYLRGVIEGNFFGVRFYFIFMPVVTAVTVFGFMHKKNAVIFHHQLPFSRLEIFAGTVLSGILLINIPNIILGIFFAVVLSMHAGGYIILYGLITSSFVFSICVFAAIISGTTLMHFITSVWLNIFVQSMVFIVSSYCRVFLKGYSEADMFNRISEFSPVTMKFRILSTESAVFAGVTIIIFISAFVLYRKLKIERAEDGITFQGIRFILNIVIGIYFMAVLGIIFYYIDQSLAVFFAASMIGVLIGTIGGYMLLNKTLDIRNLKTLRLSLVMMVISIGFMCSFVFDIYGYEKKVPEINRIASVNISLFGDESSYSDLDYNLNSYYKGGIIDFSDKDVISNTVSLHKEIIKSDENGVNDSTQFQIKYNMKDGRTFARVYDVNIRNYPQFRYIYESGEYRDKTRIENLEPYINSIGVDLLNGDEYYTVTNKKKVHEFIKAFDKDRYNRTYDDFLKRDSNYRYVVRFNYKERVLFSDIYQYDRNVLRIINEIK